MPGLQLVSHTEADRAVRKQELLQARLGMHQRAVLLRPKVHALHELFHLDLLPDHWLGRRRRPLLLHRDLLHPQGDRLAGPARAGGDQGALGAEAREDLRGQARGEGPGEEGVAPPEEGGQSREAADREGVPGEARRGGEAEAGRREGPEGGRRGRETEGRGRREEASGGREEA
jgi:hypothetical protein